MGEYLDRREDIRPAIQREEDDFSQESASVHKTGEGMTDLLGARKKMVDFLGGKKKMVGSSTPRPKMVDLPKKSSCNGSDQTLAIMRKAESKQILPENKRKGVYGTDGSRISIEKTAEGYKINGKPDEDTRRIFVALLKTPKGVQTAIEYTTSNYEFRFRLVEVIYDENNEKVHGETYEADAENKKIDDSNSNPFDHFNVDVALATTYETDRMKDWSDEMKLNVIVSHEKGHVSKGGLLQDKEHKSGVTFFDELEALFQYNIMYLNNSAISEPWLQNYNNNPDIGYKTVNKAYKSAVEGLVKSGKLEEGKGNVMIEDFISKNVPSKK